MLLNSGLGKMRRHLTACNRMKFSIRKIDAYKNKNMYPNNVCTYCIRVHSLWPTINFYYLDMISRSYIPKKKLKTDKKSKF